MKVLIAVQTCWRDRSANQFQRDTWAKAVTGADVRFYFGDKADSRIADRELLPDELHFPVNDTREGLSHKLVAMLSWALEQGYTHIFKCDHDTYVRPERLLASGYEVEHWAGSYSSGQGYPYGGPGYWLSADAARMLVTAPVTHPAEDYWLSTVLFAHGLWPTFDDRYRLIMPAELSTRGPRAENDVISVCEFPGFAQLQVHDLWIDSLERKRNIFAGLRIQ